MLYEVITDASLTYEPESSAALGFGFRCGFLGMLHMEIIQERLDREFDMNVITTVPNVSYLVHTTDGETMHVYNPSGLPSANKINEIEEPFIKAQIITKTDYIGPVMKLCMDKRGLMTKQDYLTAERAELSFDMPLGEIVFDFYDKLKSISKGYASFDYHMIGFKPAKLVRLDILLNGEMVEGLKHARITSYNVCYTKLLRNRFHHKNQNYSPKNQQGILDHKSNIQQHTDTYEKKTCKSVFKGN